MGVGTRLCVCVCVCVCVEALVFYRETDDIVCVFVFRSLSLCQERRRRSNWWT